MPLDPEVAAHLELQKGRPPRSSLTVSQTREMMVGAGHLASAPSVARVDVLPNSRQYWPADEPDLPLVVYFHGGRFFSGGLDSHDGLCRALALASSCRLLAVDYRLAPEHPFPAAVDDAVMAARFALTQADVVGIAGDSAGANLAAVAALEVPRIRCQALIYPMLDPSCSMPSHREFAAGYGPGTEDMKRGWDLYLSREPDRASPRANPLLSTNLGAAPPALVLSAEYDTLRDEGEAYARALRNGGVDVILRRWNGAIHGFVGMTAVLSMARAAVSEVGEYLRSHLRK